MTALSEYQEPIKLAGKSLGDKYQGYKIDGNSPNPDMRKDAGLGTCNSCDYLISNPTTSILVEETQLALQIRNLKREYHYLDEDQQTEFLIKHIRNEMRLKVYGSMLVLCRLSASRTESKAFLHGRKKVQILVGCKRRTGSRGHESPRQPKRWPTQRFEERSDARSRRGCRDHAPQGFPRKVLSNASLVPQIEECASLRCGRRLQRGRGVRR